MGRHIRIHTVEGTIERLDGTAIVNDTQALRRYRDRLAELDLGNGRKVGKRAAQNFVERFVVSLFSTVAHDLDDRISPHVEGLLSVRAELLERYTRILKDFGRGGTAKSVAPELARAELVGLLRKLEHHLAALEDARRGADLEERLRRHPTDAAGVLAASQHPHESLQVEVTPDSSPGPERRPRRETDPDHTRKNPNDELERRLREEQRLAPEDPEMRRRVQRRADALVSRPGDRRQFPEGTVITLYRTRAWNSGNEASLRRFEGRDERFLGRGYELQIALPNGPTFRSDGIELTPDGRYRLLESKEPETSVLSTRGRGYNTPEGQASLRRMVVRDAGIARRLREYGCAGFLYETGTKELDAFFKDTITELRRNKSPGADLLTAPGLDGN